MGRLSRKLAVELLLELEVLKCRGNLAFTRSSTGPSSGGAGNAS